MSGVDTSKVLIIAEAGVNHNGSLELACKLVDVAKEAGADAVKFQIFKAENLVSSLAEKAKYQEKKTGIAESQLEMIKKLELSFDDFIKIKRYCDKKDILFLATPFDFESVDFLESIVPLYKISSGEITNLPFLEYVAKKGKPIILSTGMANLGEIEEALTVILNTKRSYESRKPVTITTGNYTFPPLILLHCTSSYPPPPEEVNLLAIKTMQDVFKLPVGYSDHTLGTEISIAAVAMGASVIEKHFTLDRNLAGPDHKASLNPDELKAMVRAIRNVEKATGNGIKKPTKTEREIMKNTRRSLVATRDIQCGEIIKKEDIVIKRPGTGIPPKFIEIIIGKKLVRNIRKEEPFKWLHFKEGESQNDPAMWEGIS